MHNSLDDINNKEFSIDLEKGGSKTFGICEYVSLTMLYTYFHIYGNNSYYTNEQIKKYFVDDTLVKYKEAKKDLKGNKIKTIPLHKHYGKGADAGVAYDIWKANDKFIDLKLGFDVRRATKKFLSYSVKDDYSASWMHTSQPEKWIEDKHVPVMLVSGNFAHSIIIYAYNVETNEYAAHYGFAGDEMQIIKKSDIWYFTSLGFWYGIYE